MSRKKPKYMVIYKCDDCGQDSGFTELDKPKCRACGASKLTVVSKQKLTPKVLADRLKVTTDNMMRNLELAYQELTRMDDKPPLEDGDAEAAFLRLMARARNLRDNVQGLELRDPAPQRNQIKTAQGKAPGKS